MDGMRRPLAFLGDHITASGGRSRKLRPDRVSQPDECQHQADFHRCGSGGRRGRIVLMLGSAEQRNTSVHRLGGG